MSAVDDVTARSVVECTSICSQTTDCSAVSWNEQTRTCFLHIHCPPDTTCSDSSSELVHFKKKVPCQNGGDFIPETKTCLCNDGWAGDECERYPYNCVEFYQREYGTRSGPVWLDPQHDVTKLTRTQCNRPGAKVITTIFRSDGRQPHNKTYEDFVSGYYINSKNYWMGLDNVRALNQQGFDEALYSVVFDNPGMGDFKWRYSGFQIGDPSSGYPISYTTANDASSQVPAATDFDLSLSNCFENISGVSFSAWDHETTGSDCAGRHGAGWWYPDDCHAPCRLLGLRRELFPDQGEEEYLTIPGLRLDNHTVEESMAWTYLFFKT
ncbi:ficolin-1-like [Aplysia californica]|uniref:Ficolin-1-like n=1 Tax=Aplysia californica TaxID=6500 RepID=A0ABM1A7Y0_APLCA|nr:ficolin-1-like [Aplysia californica]